MALTTQEAAMRLIDASRDVLVAIGLHIDCAGPPPRGSRCLTSSMASCRHSWLPCRGHNSWEPTRISFQLKEEHRFLGNNCGLPMQWLVDIVEYLSDNDLSDHN